MEDTTLSELGAVMGKGMQVAAARLKSMSRSEAREALMDRSTGLGNDDILL